MLQNLTEIYKIIIMYSCVLRDPDRIGIFGTLKESKLLVTAAPLSLFRQFVGVKERVRQAQVKGTLEEVAMSKGLHPTFDRCNLRSLGVSEREPRCEAEIIVCTFSGSCGRVLNIHQR